MNSPAQHEQIKLKPNFIDFFSTDLMSKCNNVEFIGPLGIEVKGVCRKEEFASMPEILGPRVEFPSDVVKV